MVHRVADVRRGLTTEVVLLDVDLAKSLAVVAGAVFDVQRLRQREAAYRQLQMKT